MYITGFFSPNEGFFTAGIYYCFFSYHEGRLLTIFIKHYNGTSRTIIWDGRHLWLHNDNMFVFIWFLERSFTTPINKFSTFISLLQKNETTRKYPSYKSLSNNTIIIAKTFKPNTNLNTQIPLQIANILNQQNTTIPKTFKQNTIIFT